jgi:hypothetical protein
MSETESTATRVARSVGNLAANATDKVVDTTNAVVDALTKDPAKDPIVQVNTAPIEKARDDVNEAVGDGVEKLREKAADAGEKS